MSGSVPVYSTATGEKPKADLTRNLTVVDNDPVVLITRPRTKKKAARTQTRRAPLDKHIKPDKMVMDAAKRVVRGLEVDGQKWPPGYYSKIEPVDNETVIVR